MRKRLCTGSSKGKFDSISRMPMRDTNRISLELGCAAVIGAIFVSSAVAQQYVSKAPTAADWASLAKLPDFNGVWERGGVGAGGNTNSAFGAQPTRGGAGAAPPAAPAQRGAAA